MLFLLRFSLYGKKKNAVVDFYFYFIFLRDFILFTLIAFCFGVEKEHARTL